MKMRSVTKRLLKSETVDLSLILYLATEKNVCQNRKFAKMDFRLISYNWKTLSLQGKTDVCDANAPKI